MAYREDRLDLQGSLEGGNQEEAHRAYRVAQTASAVLQSRLDRLQMNEQGSLHQNPWDGIGTDLPGGIMPIPRPAGAPRPGPKGI